MARYTKAKCKLCRREGMKLFLKGSRCDSAKKCSFTKREYPPGPRTWQRGRPSEYNLQLREKQKVKRIYGVLEKQFMRYFKMAEAKKGNTGENLLVTLERRLDNVIFRAGFAQSRSNGRQMINHGHILVNDKKVDICSYLVNEGDTIKPKEKEKSKDMVVLNMDLIKGKEIPDWLTVKPSPPETVVLRLPKREDVAIPIDELLIIELCSK